MAEVANRVDEYLASRMVENVDNLVSGLADKRDAPEA